MSELTPAEPTIAEYEDLEDTVWEERRSFVSSVPRWLSMALLLAAFLAIWQLVTMAGIVSPLILPSPVATIEDLIFVGQGLLSANYMLTAFWVIGQEVAWGFLMAVLIGVSLGLLRPGLDALQPTPLQGNPLVDRHDAARVGVSDLVQP